MFSRQVLKRQQIIKIILAFDSWEILTLAVDTISYNYEAFAALYPIGELEHRLFQRVGILLFIFSIMAADFNQYKELRSQLSQQPFNKPFVTAFIELLSGIGKEGHMKQELEYDLENFELLNPRSQVARSPISETMDDIFDDGDMENNEEIDRLWHTGATVDRENLARLYETTVSRMETSFEDPDNQSHILSATRGLSKLRQFDSVAFDEVSKSWVLRMQNYSNRSPLFKAFSSFIPGACLKIEALTNVTAKVLSRCHDGAILPFDGGMFVGWVLRLLVEENPFNTLLSAKVDNYQNLPSYYS